MKNARAFTLIEMLVCISVGSVLMGLALGMVHRTMRIENSARSNARVERTASLLSRQFRHDIHQTQIASLEGLAPMATLLRLILPEESPITYRLEKNFVLREQQQSSRQTHRESFAFPDGYLFQVAKLDDPLRVVLTLEQDTKLIGVSPQIKLHVEAVVGQFHRLRRTAEVFE